MVEQRVVVPLARVRFPLATHLKISLILGYFFSLNRFIISKIYLIITSGDHMVTIFYISTSNDLIESCNTDKLI